MYSLLLMTVTLLSC